MKKIPKGFMVILFLFVIAMIVFGYVRNDVLFYVRAGILPARTRTVG